MDLLIIDQYTLSSTNVNMYEISDIIDDLKT